jgi:hypothetical protein
VPYHESTRSARKSSICYHRDFFSQALTNERCRDCQHFPHTGAAFGPLVSDHDNLTLKNLTSRYRIKCPLLGIKHPRFSCEFLVLYACDLDYGALGRKSSLQDLECSLVAYRVVKMLDYFFIWFVIDINRVEIGLHSLSCNGHGFSMEKTLSQQAPEHYGNPSHFVKVEHDVCSSRPHVGNVRSPLADALKIRKCEFDTHFPCNCE